MLVNQKIFVNNLLIFNLYIHALSPNQFFRAQPAGPPLEECLAESSELPMHESESYQMAWSVHSFYIFRNKTIIILFKRLFLPTYKKSPKYYRFYRCSTILLQFGIITYYPAGFEVNKINLTRQF